MLVWTLFPSPIHLTPFHSLHMDLFCNGLFEDTFRIRADVWTWSRPNSRVTNMLFCVGHYLLSFRGLCFIVWCACLIRSLIFQLRIFLNYSTTLNFPRSSPWLGICHFCSVSAFSAKRAYFWVCGVATCSRAPIPLNRTHDEYEYNLIGVYFSFSIFPPYM